MSLTFHDYKAQSCYGAEFSQEQFNNAVEVKPLAPKDTCGSKECSIKNKEKGKDNG